VQIQGLIAYPLVFGLSVLAQPARLLHRRVQLCVVLVEVVTTASA
jgi:hypothetical protein